MSTTFAAEEERGRRKGERRKGRIVRRDNFEEEDLGMLEGEGKERGFENVRMKGERRMAMRIRRLIVVRLSLAQFA